MADQTNINSNQLLDKMLKLGQATGDVKQSGGVPFIVIPNDCKMQSLADVLYSKFAPRPHRIVQSVTVRDVGGFVAYYTLFSDPNSRIFADEKKNAVLAILDYHAAGEGAPRWGDHRLTLALEHSDEWAEWIGKNGQDNRMNQVAFAEFIEDHTADIREPDAATMLEMSRSLQAKTDVDYTSAIRLNNGQVQLAYNEQVKGTYGAGKVEIPETFLISIPIFTGSIRQPITARLRYRLVSGKLSIWYDLLRYRDIARDAFKGAVAEITDALKATAIKGSAGV